MKFYAKTYYEDGKKKGETIQEHTENLLEGLNQLHDLYFSELENLYGKSIFWNDLKIVCLLHDLGKISVPFQNKVRRYLNEEELPLIIDYKEIPHNYLSPSFLVGFKELGKHEAQERLSNLIYTIAFHHERPFDFDKETFENAINKDLSSNYTKLVKWIQSHYKEYSQNNLKPFYFSLLRSYLDGNNYKINKLKRSKYFILLKGLLHRLDYAASAHLPVETERLGETTPYIINYLNRKYQVAELKPFQKNGKNYQNNNIVLTASTGMGKTEFAINWLGDSKGFYTLPLKVSANAMFERLNQMFNKKVGILHSDSYSLALENEELSFENNIQRINVSRQLSLPLIVTTADQLFTSVFKWPGYERIYATLMYSKVILDEPQSYSPKTLAMIIKALEEIASFGGKFCYMSATNHPFIINKLRQIAEILSPVFNQEKKHKIEIIDQCIDNLKEKIVNSYEKRNKVLVITNTVKKSQELFGALKEHIPNINLLHSGFIKKDRDLKEQKIQKDFTKKEAIVWVSTQIVEASLDIDYDILYTEIATLDALIQRMGRVFRRVGRTINEKDSPNIIIASSKPSDKGFIYNKEIVTLTRNALENWSEKIITEEIKQELINEVYAEKKIKTTNFYKEYNNAYQLLELGFESSSKNEAQQLFREIAQVSAIPVAVYEKNDIQIDQLIKKLKSNKLSLIERLEANHELNKFMLSIPAWRSKNASELFKQKSSSVFLIPAKYDDKIGLMYDEIENIF